MLNLLNVYCCVSSHNDNDYIEQLSSGIGFSKSGDLLTKSFSSGDEESSTRRPAFGGKTQLEPTSSDSEAREEQSFRFLDESSNIDSDEAESMEADQNEGQSEFDILDSHMNDVESCDEYSEEDDFFSDASPF